MAGPFSPTPQQDIAPIRLQQTELAQSAAEAGGVATAIGQAVAGVQEVRKINKREDLQAKIDSVVQGLRVFREGDASAVQELEDAAKQGNATAAAKLEEYRAIQRAKAQGRLPSDAATMRLRAITKAAINDAPEFADDFRAAARQALGFSPEAEATRRVLREPAAGAGGGKSKTDIAREEYQALVWKIQNVTGVNQQQAEAIARRRMSDEMNASNARDQMALGDLSDRNLAALANASTSSILTDTLGVVAQQMAENGGIYDINAAQTLLMTNVQAAKARALQGVTDPRVATQIQQTFNDTQTGLMKLLESASMQEQAQSFIGTMSKLQAAGMGLDHPELLAWMTLPNADTVFKVMETSARLNDNPRLMKALGLTSVAEGQKQSQAVFNNIPKMFRDAMYERFSGQMPSSDVNANARAYGDREELKDQKIDEKRSGDALSDIVKIKGSYTAITALDDPQILRKVGNSPALTEQVRALLETKLEVQKSKIRLVKDQASAYDVVQEGNKLVMRRKAPVVGAAPTFESPVGHVERRDIELRDELDKYNRMVEINNKYANVGVSTKIDVGGALESPTQEDIDVTTANATPTTEAAAPKRYRYDPNTDSLVEVK